MTARTTATDSDAAARSSWGDERASDAVVRAIADAREADPMDVEPLYGSIDLDALDRLFGTLDVPTGQFTFEAAGCRVTVRADGEASATRIDERTGAE